MAGRPRQLAVGLFVWAMALAVASGQTGSSQQAAGVVIDGTVVDASNVPLPGVRVTLEQSGNVLASQASDTAGKFRFEKVQPGSYDLKATLAGFKTLVYKLTAAPSATTVLVTLRMQVGALGETVEVTAATPMVPATPAEVQLSLSSPGRGGVATFQSGVATDQFHRYAPFANTEAYARIEKNPFKLTTDDPLSTFAADVDTASFANVRRFLTKGELPPFDAVRVEELLNYFRFAYAEPERNRPVSITTEVGECPWAPDHKLMLVGLRAKPIEQRTVPGRNLVLLVDVSGSMMPPDKLPLVKTALRMFVDTLRDDDRIAIVVYAGASGLALPSTRGRFRSRIHDAIEHLHAGGSTNGGQGLTLAYKVAEEQFIEGGINRVILATDGDFNVGIVGQGDLFRLIDEKKRTGIFLSVLGVGTGNLKDQTMEMLADRGNGHYAYLDSLHEARRVLVREGGATLETVAKDVKFQIEFNPAMVSAYKLIGYENRLLQHRDFNDDRKDGGELGAGHTVTVLYEIVPTGATLPEELANGTGRATVDPLKYQTNRQPTGGSPELATVKVRYKLPAQETSSLMEQPVGVRATASHLPFAAAVAEFGLLLRDAKATDDQWSGLLKHVRALDGRAMSADRDSFVELVELAAGLRRLR